MRKLVLWLALAVGSIATIHAVNQSDAFGSVQRYDRGYLGNNYDDRIRVINDGLIQHTGDIPY